MGNIQNSYRKGFTLIEILIVVTIIATIASIAIPNLISARLVANETAAIAALKAVTSAQAVMQQQGVVDSNNNGVGEFSFFGEMSGRVAIRGTSSFATPPAMSASFGAVSNSQVSRSGYLFQMYLPGLGGVAVAEDAQGGCSSPGSIDSQLAEVVWCVYAWPSQRGSSGKHAFFVNQQGEILQMNNDGVSGPAYSGALGGPPADAAFSAVTAAGDITGPIASGATGMDSNSWMTLGR